MDTVTTKQTYKDKKKRGGKKTQQNQTNTFRGFPTRMVQLYNDIQWRYTILVGNSIYTSQLDNLTAPNTKYIKNTLMRFMQKKFLTVWFQLLNRLLALLSNTGTWRKRTTQPLVLTELESLRQAENPQTMTTSTHTQTHKGPNIKARKFNDNTTTPLH